MARSSEVSVTATLWMISDFRRQMANFVYRRLKAEGRRLKAEG
jgi:hypothetical protein